MSQPNAIIPEYKSEYPLNLVGDKADERLLIPILSSIPSNASTVIEPFGGTGLISWCLKHRGHRVLINDIRRYAHLQHKVLVENNSVLLSDKQLKTLSATNRRSEDHTRNLYGNVFGRKNSTFLDSWAANIAKIPSGIQQSIATFLPVVTIVRRYDAPMCRFTAAGDLWRGQHFRDVDLEAEVFHYAQDVLPRLLCDNKKANHAFHGDAVTLVRKVKADAAYFDTPYCCKQGLYAANYCWFDNLVLLLSNRATEIKTPHGYDSNLSPYTHFAVRTSALEGFVRLFRDTTHIPLTIYSYNRSSDIDPDELADMARPYGWEVSIQDIRYPLPCTVKGRDKWTTEVLIKCRNETKKGREV